MTFLFLMRHLIFRQFSTSLATVKHDPLTRVNSIISKHPVFEPELDRIYRIVNPRIVSTIVMHQPNVQLGLRFFIWAMKYKFLKTWEIKGVVIDTLMKMDNGFDVYWEVIENVWKCGVGIDSDAFLVLISGYFKGGNIEKAVESFGRMKDFDCKPNVYVYNTILDVLMRRDVFLLALAVYSQMLKFNCEPNVVTYSILIDGLCKSGKVVDALRLFDEMTERGILPNTITYTIVLTGLCQAKRPYEAKELLNKMTGDGCLPDAITRNGLIAGFCKLGKVDEAFLLLNVFKNQGYALGINGYSCLIDGLFRLKRFEEANKLFHKVVKENVSPDVVLYTIMFKGFCEAGRVKDAWKLFLEMTNKGVVPDTQCYNVLIKGFCDVGLLKEAQSLKLEISKNDCFPDTHTNTILICGMCKKGLVGEAKQLFEEMEKLGCLPSVVTFNALIDGLCKAEKPEEARLMFYKMEIGRNPALFLRLSQGADRVMDKESLQNLIARFCDSGLYLKAYKLLSQLADNGVLPDIVTYNILINGMCNRRMRRNRNTDGALKIFRELQLRGVSPDAVTYGTLINGLFKAHKDDEAMKLFEDMIKEGVSPTSSIYKSLMVWSCRRKKLLMSFTLWLGYLRRLENRDVDIIRSIEEHFKKGEFVEAIRGLLKMDFEMKDFDLGPYTIWLIGFCYARRPDDALKIFRTLLEFKAIVTPPSCVKLIEAFCLEQKLDLAAEVLLYGLEKGFNIKPRFCNLILYLMFRSKPHVKNALSLISKMDAVGFDLKKHLSPITKSLWKYHAGKEDRLMKVMPETKFLRQFTKHSPNLANKALLQNQRKL